MAKCWLSPVLETVHRHRRAVPPVLLMGHRTIPAHCCSIRLAEQSHNSPYRGTCFAMAWYCWMTDVLLSMAAQSNTILSMDNRRWHCSILVLTLSPTLKAWLTVAGTLPS